MKSRSDVEKHFDIVAGSYDSGKVKYSYYYGNLKKLLKTLILKNKRVFEIGCGTGDLLNSVKPKYGYGMDISSEMIRIANMKYSQKKQIHFSIKWPKDKFDYIFMSDVIEHLENPVETFQKISKLMGPKTIFINTMANPIWEPVLMVAEKLRLKMPEGKHKRIKYMDLGFMIQESGMKITRHGYRLLIPIKIPIITDFANKYLEKGLQKLAFIEYFVAFKF
ncbi:MAG: class I SAM-dependent methyltransferase [Candidatus Microgenomates bacterium]|jgi:ubiquinone/menaquinone biosynthesis C-methylase UbiE